MKQMKHVFAIGTAVLLAMTSAEKRLQQCEQTQDAVSLAMKASMEVFETWTTPLDIGIYRAKLISDAVASE